MRSLKIRCPSLIFVALHFALVSATGCSEPGTASNVTMGSGGTSSKVNNGGSTAIVGGSATAIVGGSATATATGGGRSAQGGNGQGGNVSGGVTASAGGTSNNDSTRTTSAGGSTTASTAAGGRSATGGVTTGGIGIGGKSTSSTAGGASSVIAGGRNAGGAFGGSGPGGVGGTANGTVGGSTGTNANATCIATAAVAAMKLGWNLGNSLDSVDASKTDTTVETAWNNPKVTPELIAAVATAGFGVVRIPVSWINHFGAAPDYTISAAFMARVEEVVKYVLDRNLYVILNTHHDGSEGVTGQWISLVDASKQVTSAHNDQVADQFKKIWTQIANRFKGYGDHLILESMNEIKVGYDAPIQAYYDQVNRLNQVFVDTVRGTGGNNATRCLVVPGYNTNIDYTVAGFVSPKDTSTGKLILSDHFYDPWDFAGAAKTHAWGTGNAGIDTWGQEDSVRAQVAKLKSNFIDKGLPMIWGEYGAVNQDGYEKYRRYYMEYVTKAAHDVGIVPIFWDKGATNSGEDAFGLINRTSNTVQFPTILEAMLRAVTSNYSLSDVAKP